MNQFRMTSIALGMLVILQLGCGASDQPELGQVAGTITLDGVPLTGVAVVFQPDNGRPARGMTDAEGKYELTYIRQTKGTKVGPNLVEIAPTEEGEGSVDVETGDGESQPASNLPKSGKPVVPARYNAQSELKVDVKPGENTFDFQLESK
jgi:hypothetical protein